MVTASRFRNKSPSKRGNSKVKNSRNAHNSGAKSQEWVNCGLWLSFPLLFHLNKQGGWPGRAQRGGAGGVEEERGGVPWLEYNQREGVRRGGGRGQADHVIVKSLQAAVLGKADIPPYWRCRFTTTTVLGNGCRLYCSYYLHGTDSTRLSLSSSATVAVSDPRALLLPLIPPTPPPPFLLLFLCSLSRLTRF